MAETKQISFDLRELATALIKHQGLHEGSWLAGFEFTFGAGNFGSTPEDVKPGAVLQINNVLLVRQDAAHPAGLAVDAANVNPEPKAQKTRKPAKS